MSVAAPLGCLRTLPARRLRDAAVVALLAVGLSPTQVAGLDVADLVDELGRVREQLEVDGEPVSLTPAARVLLEVWIDVRGKAGHALVVPVHIDRPGRRRLARAEVESILRRTSASA